MGGINDFALSRDENHIISVGQERKILIWDNRQNDLIFSRFIEEENDEGLSIALSHDGKYFVTGGTQGILRLWEVNFSDISVKQLHSVAGHSKAITSVAFGLDDKQVISVGEDGSILVWWFFTQ